MPEGDTIFRAAARLRPVLEGQTVIQAEATRPGPMIERVVGTTITEVQTRGKHLNVLFDNGLMLHTHMRMNGFWRVYAPGSVPHGGGRPPRVSIETAAGVAACYDAPTVELFRQAARALHAPLTALGPDLLAPDFDEAEAVRRLTDPARAPRPLGELLLDQTAMAGVGNVYKSEILFIERLDPWRTAAEVDEAGWLRIVRLARDLLMANRMTDQRRTTTIRQQAAGSRLWVYGRTNRPCLRCGARIQSRMQGRDLPRRTYWCANCQR